MAIDGPGVIEMIAQGVQTRICHIQRHVMLAWRFHVVYIIQSLILAFKYQSLWVATRFDSLSDMDLISSSQYGARRPSKGILAKNRLV